MSFDFRSARDSILDSKLPPLLRLVAIVLIEAMPDCRPSIARVAERTGVERKAAMRAISKLERMGVFVVDRGNGRRSSYTLQPVPLWRTGPKTVPVPDKGTDPVPLQEDRPQNGTGPFEHMGPVPFETQTSPLAEGPEAVEADQKAVSTSQAAPDTLPVVRDVFAEWQRVHNHPTAKLDTKRTARIRSALKLHTPNLLKSAVRGALKDDWLMGRDPKSPRKYDGLETILRDAAQVERLAELDSCAPNGRSEAFGVGPVGWRPDGRQIAYGSARALPFSEMVNEFYRSDEFRKCKTGTEADKAFQGRLIKAARAKTDEVGQ